MAEAVAKYFPEGTRISHPRGGFVLWVECPRHVDSMELHKQALANGISIAPGPIFSARKKFSNCIRLNTAFWSPKEEQAIEKLGKLAARA
jgi:DNA-binding transcriptional MocR family regulator